jgi:hypothetical protein
MLGEAPDIQAKRHLVDRPTMGPSKMGTRIERDVAPDCAEKCWPLAYPGLVPWVSLSSNIGSPVAVVPTFNEYVPTHFKAEYEISLLCNEKSVNSVCDDIITSGGGADSHENHLARQMMLMPQRGVCGFSEGDLDERPNVFDRPGEEMGIMPGHSTASNQNEFTRLCSRTHTGRDLCISTGFEGEAAITSAVFSSHPMTVADALYFPSLDAVQGPSRCLEVLGDTEETRLSSSGEQGVYGNCSGDLGVVGDEHSAGDGEEDEEDGFDDEADVCTTMGKGSRRSSALLHTTVHNATSADPFAALNMCMDGVSGGTATGGGIGMAMGLPIGCNLGLGPDFEFLDGSVLDGNGNGVGDCDAAGLLLDDANLTKEERARRRRDFHKVHTRRSRAKLNDKMDELRRVLPAPPAGRSLKSKAQILDWAILFATAQMEARGGDCTVLGFGIGVGGSNGSGKGTSGRRRVPGKMRKK